MLDETQYFYVLIAFGISLLVHYWVIELSHKKGVFLDEYEKVQKVHINPTPRIGGLGIFLSLLFIAADHNWGVPLILTAIPAFIAGFLEDYSGKIKPTQRLGIMCLSPIMAFIILHSSILQYWGGFIIPTYIGVFLSLVLVLALINGVNFSDGQNGLASSSALISTITLCILSYHLKSESFFYILCIIAAAITAFLLYNYPKGRIFLGDGGAYVLGFLLSIISILLTQLYPLQLSPLLIPAILIYPLWEVVFSTLRKIFYDRMSPLHSDHHHLHQLLYRNFALGKSYAVTVMITPFQIIIALVAIAYPNNTLLLSIAIIAYIVLYCTVYTIARAKDFKKLVKAATNE
jgi:UDP-N-acetylmuramyl pentapeptide phosphotransferase/UDP-N-acetylglucosamine-1-phosphate transferase